MMSRCFVRLLPRTLSTSIMLATTMTYTILVPATANTTKVVATTVTIYHYPLYH